MLQFVSIWAKYLRALTGARRYGAAFVFGLMAGLAFPPFNAVAGLWFFFPSLIFLLQGTADKRRAFALGWCFAFGQLVVSLYWIAGALFVDIQQFWWLVPFAALGLPAAFAVYYGFATLVAFRWGLSRLDGLLMFAVLWALADYARGHLFTGLPWDITGYVWGGVLPVMQLVSITGVYGLSLITMALVVLPAGLAFPLRFRSSLALFVLSLVFLAGVAAWGHGRLAHAAAAVVPGVRLRLVQPDVDQRHKWRHDERDANFQELIHLSFAPAEKPVTHIIWPETATAFYLTEDENVRRALAGHMQPGQSLLTGVVQRGVAAEGTPLFFNSLIAIDSQAHVTAGYAKFHLVPFGEYVPYRSLLPFRAVAAVGDFTPGDGVKTLRVAGLPPFSPLVCYEAIFPGEVARRDDPPELLVNVTNDAWYEGTTGPLQHFAIVRGRAIEEGVPLVRAANKGIDAVVDSYGRIRALSAPDGPGFLDSDLPRALPEKTFYVRWGAAVFWGLTFVFLIIITLARSIACKSINNTQP